MPSVSLRPPIIPRKIGAVENVWPARCAALRLLCLFCHILPARRWSFSKPSLAAFSVESRFRRH